MADNNEDITQDVGFTEEQMIAQAIALSLTPSPQLSYESQPSRAATNQSIDSVLSPDSSLVQGSELRQQSSQGTSGGFSSVSSSPDLGISTSEALPEDMDTRTRGDGCVTGDEAGTVPPDVINESTPCTRDELPYARLSSLHDKSNSLDQILPPSAKPSHAVNWRPNQDCLELIIGMGISENAARRALYYTGNINAEVAISWVFENINDPNLHTPFEPPSMINSSQTSAFGPGPVYHSFDDFIQATETFKMVFVVNNSLKMGVGKIAAQVGHATLGLYRFTQGQADQGPALKTWEDTGSKKIVLKAETVDQLLELKRKAYERKVPNIVVHDAGRTQVEPGSLTVLALFGRLEAVDSITGHLKLL